MRFLYGYVGSQTSFICVIYQLLIRKVFQFRDMTMVTLTPFIASYTIQHSDVMSSS